LDWSPACNHSKAQQIASGNIEVSAGTAGLVRFLMSDAGGWITGQVLYSNGGFRTSG
jgi:3-oxoacyl-[acyl-carrier protein] reductase